MSIVDVSDISVDGFVVFSLNKAHALILSFDVIYRVDRKIPIFFYLN